MAVDTVSSQLIVLEGGDASGKTTQFELLKERLAGRMKFVSFPRYGEPSAALLEAYLAGTFGASPYDVNPYIASSFYAVDRAASFLSDWGKNYRAGETVFAYRYTTSNAIYNAAKLPENEWVGFWTWLEEYEYGKLGLPKPDHVIFLDVPPGIAQTLLTDRGGGDIHETVRGYQTRCHDAAAAAAKHHGWHMINCAPGVTLRTVQDINDELVGLIHECCLLPR